MIPDYVPHITALGMSLLSWLLRTCMQLPLECATTFTVMYRKQGKTCWAQLSWFLWFLIIRVPQNFPPENLAIVKQ